MQNLTVVSLRSNYFSSSDPSGFISVEVLDLSLNLLNGFLPLGYGGEDIDVGVGTWETSGRWVSK